MLWIFLDTKPLIQCNVSNSHYEYLYQPPLLISITKTNVLVSRKDKIRTVRGVRLCQNLYYTHFVSVMYVRDRPFDFLCVCVGGGVSGICPRAERVLFFCQQKARICFIHSVKDMMFFFARKQKPAF